MASNYVTAICLVLFLTSSCYIESDNMTKTIKSKMQAYRVELPCEAEGCDGMMVFTSGGVLTSFPAQYPHRCSECGRQIYVSGMTYPTIEWSP